MPIENRENPFAPALVEPMQQRAAATAQSRRVSPREFLPADSFVEPIGKHEPRKSKMRLFLFPGFLIYSSDIGKEGWVLLCPGTDVIFAAPRRRSSAGRAT